MEDNKKKYCANCHYPLGKAKYCAHCGQKNTDGRISIGEFFSVFFSTVFNLESKFFQTLRDIFIPGKLTNEWFKGRHKPYFHPVRLFIVSALLLIAAIGLQITEDTMSFTNIHKRAEKSTYKKGFLLDMDSLSRQTIEKFPEHSSLKPAFDTLYKAMIGKDSLQRDSIKMSEFVVVGGIDEGDQKVSNEDFINLSTEELLEKYKVEGFLKRLLFQQKIKLFKDKGNFAPFLLGNSLWIILLMMPFLALILKILYIRHDYYYVEHLIFSFHTHSFAFILFAIISLIVVPTDLGWLVMIGFLILFVYLHKSLRKVYGQSRWKTLFKLLFVNFIYLFMASGFLILGLLISMAIF